MKEKLAVMWRLFLALWGTTAGKKTVAGVLGGLAGLLIKVFPPIGAIIGPVNADSIGDLVMAISAIIAAVGQIDAKIIRPKIEAAARPEVAQKEQA